MGESERLELEKKYWTKELRTLVGGVINATLCTVEDMGGYDELFFGFKIKLSDGKLKDIIFLSDEEGNGGGRFEIQDSVQ